jgi:hypothetical protein
MCRTIRFYIRNYVLTYEVGQAAGRSRLTSITEKDGGVNAMPQWQLSWQDGGSSGVYSYPTDPDSPSGNFSNAAAWTGDFNGDGKWDIITHNNGQLVTYVSQGGGQYNPVSVADPVNGFTNTTVWVGDVDGDGIMDLLVCGVRPLTLANLDHFSLTRARKWGRG